MRIRWFSIATTASTLLSSLTLQAQPAQALPGQSTAEFLKWLKVPQLSVNLEKQTDELSGWPTYHVRNGDRGVTWDLRALEDGNGTIREERFSMAAGTGEPGSTPVRHDGTGYGFSIFGWLLGKDVAADFKNAKLVAPFPAASDNVPRRFYRGVRFGYIDDGHGSEIHLLTFKWLDTAIATQIHCSKPGVTCGE